MSTEELTHTVLGDGTIAELAEAVRGEVIGPADPSYDEARAIWNGAHDRRPALIVRCAGVADVVRAVEFARSQDLEIAVRGGSHSIPGFSTVDGGIVIDLSAMQGIRVDPEAGTARAQGGVQWGEFDHETQAFGLAVTGGLVSTTGLGGFTLGGGIGWLVRKHGLTCDNLISADVVTADGRLVTASAEENAELRELGDPVADLMGPIPYTALQSLLDPLWPHGKHTYMKAGYVHELDDAAIETAARYHQEATSPASEIHFHHFGGAVARVDAGATAYREREAPYVMNVIAASFDGAGFD